MNGTLRRQRAWSSTLFPLLLSCLLCSLMPATAASPADSDEATIAPPDLAALEPTVAEQLAHARELWQQSRDAPVEQKVKVLGELGRLYHAYELWEAAMASYGRALALEPDNFELQHLLGHAAQQAGEHDAAERAFRAAIALRSDYPATALHLAELLRLQNRRDEAIALIDPLLASQPPISAARLLRAELALADRAYAKAIALLEQVLREVPQANRAHYLLAQAYRGEGKLEQARQHLALSGSVGVRIPDPLLDQVDRLTVGARVALIEGKLAYQAGDYAHAAQRYRAALQADPDSISAAINLAASLVQLGEVDTAVGQLRRVLQRAPDNLNAQFNLAQLLSQGGDHREALRHYQTITARRPDDLAAVLGVARSAAAIAAEAISDAAYQQALALAPERSDIWLELIERLLAEGRFEQAGEVLTQARGRHPEDGQLAHRHAEYLLSRPDQPAVGYALALDLAARVFEARRTPEHAVTLARALAANSQCAQAVELQVRIIAELEQDADNQRRAQAKADLARYRAGPPCFEPQARR